MTTQHFDILIDAPPERVWRYMLFSPTYERWTSAFCEGSRYEGGWDTGQTIRFMGPNGDGMVSVIAEAGGTRVRVAADVFGTYEAYMAETWPRALALLKTLCEGEPS